MACTSRTTARLAGTSSAGMRSRSTRLTCVLCARPFQSSSFPLSHTMYHVLLLLLPLLLLQDLKVFMRYNDWQNDPLSEGNAANQIAARYDLITNTPPGQMTASAGGSIDAKLTSSALLAEGNVWAVAGPTYTNQPVFTWDSKWNDQPHEGQPTVFKFDYVQFSLP